MLLRPVLEDERKEVYKMGLYSIKMRASREKDHISGAENIVEEKDLEEAVGLLVKRAMTHSKGKSDFVNIKIEAINEKELEYLEPLRVTTVNVKDHLEGIKAVEIILCKLGIDKEKAKKIINKLRESVDMRGAMLLDINTLERLEHDKERGIRATYMDFQGSKINHLTKNTKCNAHFIEALALATKVANAPNIIGEICYSDDPNYTAGYIASKKYGYIRFPYLKEMGHSKGGRVFLYDSTNGNVEKCIEYIEKIRVIIKDEIKFNKELPYESVEEI